MKYKETAVITEQKEIAADIYSMWLQTENIAGEAVPGQFLSLYSRDRSRMLPRPISICQIDRSRAVFVWYTGGQERGPENFPGTARETGWKLWGLWAMDFRWIGDTGRYSLWEAESVFRPWWNLQGGCRERS